MIRAIVLAAGLSRRMGEENKLLLPFGGSTVLETTIGNISTAELGETVVVVGHEAGNILPVLNKYTHRVLGVKNLCITPNLDYETGMTSSIQAGVRVPENEDETHYMICLSDMVLIKPNEYQYLKKQFLDILKRDEKAIVLPIFNGKKGNPVIFSHFYKNDILNLTYTEGGKPIVQANPNSVYFVEMPSDSVLKDMDNKEDYERMLNEIF
jgi:molybdenum cofactor cytidylyltransferase